MKEQRALGIVTIMSDANPPPLPQSDAARKKFRLWPRLIIYPLLILAVLAVLKLIVTPYLLGRVGGQVRKADAATNTMAITAALKAYHVEYDHWPDFVSDGLFLDEKRQGQLMRVLRAKDPINNRRRIVFIDGRDATETSGKYLSGFHPTTDVFYDPWGQPYRIALEADYDNTIANPYPDDGPIQTSVIVWSLGKDGQQGAPANPRTHKGSDDVTSWQ